MNDTTKNELTNQVADMLDEMSLLDITETAERVIALVRAAAWQEFEAAMMSDGVLDAACRNLFDQIEEGPENTWEYVCKMYPKQVEESRLIMKNNASALLAAIAPEEDTDER